MPIAQLNIARARFLTDDPRMGDFMRGLDRVNLLADRAKGFIWRLQEENGNATGIKRDGDPKELLNLSVWETPEDLEAYVFGTLHVRFYRRGPEWFEEPTAPHFVIWPVAEGHRPTMEEALAKLAHLTEHGPSPDAYGWDALPNAKLRMEQRCA